MPKYGVLKPALPTNLKELEPSESEMFGRASAAVGPVRKGPPEDPL